MIAPILSAFQALVKDFEHRLPLQKADRMVGLFPLWLTSIIPLWPTRRQADGESAKSGAAASRLYAVRRATDTPARTVQDMSINRGADIVVP
jgi:hypothetical protein